MKLVETGLGQKIKGLSSAKMPNSVFWESGLVRPTTGSMSKNGRTMLEATLGTMLEAMLGTTLEATLSITLLLA
jgi:hypothetical protein